jgi:RNA polymerase sigma-70 factor (ECF subfamily)
VGKLDSRGKIVSFPDSHGLPGRRTPELLTFEEALASNLDSLYATARRLVRDPAQAEDLVQEVALKAYRSFKDLRSHERFRAWLFTILHNTARNLVRDASRRVPSVDVELDTLLDDPLLAEPLNESPEQQLLRECLPEQLEEGLNALPQAQRTVLWLVDVQEFTLAEVAEILDIPLGTVASRLHRAHRALRAHLEQSAQQGPGPKGSG